MGQCHEIIVQTKGYILICVVTIIFEWTPQCKIQYGTNCKIASVVEPILDGQKPFLLRLNSLSRAPVPE